MAICGIYKITNKETGECYIGQSIDIFRRLKEHTTKPYDKDDWHTKLQQEPEKYYFEILTQCNPIDLNDEENYYIYKFNAVNNGYNKKYGNYDCLPHINSSNITIPYDNTLSSDMPIFKSSNQDEKENIKLYFDPSIIINGYNQIADIDSDILVYHIYCSKNLKTPSATEFLELFNICKNSGYGRYKNSYKKLENSKFLINYEPVENILHSTPMNIMLDFNLYRNLKEKANKYALLFICLIELSKITKEKISFDFFHSLVSWKSCEICRTIIYPTVDLLNQKYYSNSVTMQIYKNGGKYDKIKFN